MKAEKTANQIKFEEQTPSINDVNIHPVEYLQTFAAWLELQIDRKDEQVKDLGDELRITRKNLQEAKNKYDILKGQQDAIISHDVRIEFHCPFCDANVSSKIYKYCPSCGRQLKYPN